MFGQNRITLFTLFGFPVRFHPSWFIILFLVTWTLAVGYFPIRYGPAISTEVYWMMGLIGALGLFVSVIIHEFFHSFMARRFGLPIHGITLFLFGGVSEMVKEASSPKAEFLIAIIGPVISVVLAGVFYLIALFISQAGGSVVFLGIFSYLAWINLILAIFNMLPAFPLDGGRVLRAGLWQWKHNIEWATRIAARIGKGFGVLLIALGILSLLVGSFIGGIWWILIGSFLHNAAKNAYEQLLMQKSLAGLSVQQFMQTQPVTVPADITLRKLVEDYFYRYPLKTYPVVAQEGRLAGCVQLDQVKTVPKVAWSDHQVAEVVQSCPVDQSITPDTEITEAIAKMEQTGQMTLMVTINDHLLGTLSLPDVMAFLSTKQKLEEDSR